MSNTIDSYDKYLRIQRIENIFSKKEECSVGYIIKKTKYPYNTVYRIINLLLKHNVITSRKVRTKKCNRIYKVFKIKAKKRGGRR